ncbi:MAG: glycosyltransferase [Phycisphaerales bacterium]|nr:glycosyltransferase [Phycisphaerales bacterium]
MHCSVIFPTRGRPAKLAVCLSHLARQSMARHRFEVLVGIDGPDDESERLAGRLGAELGLQLTVVPLPRLGIAGVKNELLRRARGTYTVSINDDVLPHPAFLDAHLAAQREAYEHLGRHAMILGESAFLAHHDDSAFDALVRRTSMIFFYDRMIASPHAADPWHDWGFRHAWNLNLSLPTSAAVDAGGFSVFPCPYGYEDLELAFRLRESASMPVLWRRDALAPHDHRYSPEGYLDRELKLGYAALGFARTAPACALATFRRDIASGEERAECRRFLTDHAAEARARLPEFLALTLRPAHSAEPEAALREIYERHLPLKRWVWRAGLLAAFEGVPFESLDISALLPAPGSPMRSAA